MTLSSASLSGTVSKEAEQRFTPNNNSVLSFTMKILRYDGRAKEEKTYPVRVTLWGDHEDKLARLKAGARVLVTGRLEINQFTDSKGTNVRLASIEANDIKFLDELSQSIMEIQASSNISEDESMSSEPPFNPSSGSEEEIPF